MPSMAALLHKAMWLRRTRTVALCVVALLVAVSIGLLVGAKPAHADTIITVNSMEDAGDVAPSGVCNTAPFPEGTEPECTLRAAIQEANANGVSDTIVFDPFLSGTITLTLGQLTIANDTPANDDLIIRGPGARKITVSGNDASRVFLIGTAADISIVGLTISDGRVADSGGGINLGGFATVALTNTTVSNNTARANCGGGISNSGATDEPNTVTLTNTTVSNNTALCGGGIFNSDGAVRLTNSTVSNNTATGDIGGGGIFNSDGAVSLTNTIVARNTATTNPDAQGTFTSLGNNLIGDTTGSSGWGASDLQNVDPLLGPLQDNGGPTNTHALLPGSPAVDAANNTTCPSTDQRGETRPKDGDGNGTVICDIGAFEQQDIVAPTVKSVSPTGKRVSPRANVTATFSEAMDEASVEAPGAFTLKKGTTTVSATVTYDPNTRKATLNPARKLRSGDTYVATVTTAAKDTAGNALDQDPNTAGNQPKRWRFKVK